MTVNEQYPIGEKWIFDIEVAEIEHELLSLTRMRYRILTGAKAGETGEVALSVSPLGNGKFLVSWQEHDNSTVVHVEDFADCVFWSCYTSPTAQFFRIKGRMRRASAV